MTTTTTKSSASMARGVGTTPFRYPGGKAFFADALADRIAATPQVDTYAEPYAGGAGAAIELLARGTVQRLILNDFDRRIHAAWSAMLFQTERFIEMIKTVDLSIEAWWQFRDLVEENAPDADVFELGFATYYLNRTNHSGVILGAGPIGGYKQTGKWLIDARFYRNTMIRRIEWLGAQRDRITLSNSDGLEFLRSFDADQADKTFFFIDPPYVKAGKKLYLNAMSHTKHNDLAKFLICGKPIKHWLVTYDKCALIKEAYAEAVVEDLSVRYSLHKKREEYEVCIVPSPSQ